MRAGRGFTLVELMIVVVIIGVLAAIAAPSVSEMIQRQRIHDDVQKVVAGLQEIRNFARTRLRCIEVAINGDEIVATPYAAKQFGVSGNACAGVTTVADAALPDEKISIKVEHVTLGSFTATGLEGNLWFDRRAATFNMVSGQPLLHPAELILTDARGGSYKVRIYPATGTVRLLK